jgi:hypothetical protein
VRAAVVPMQQQQYDVSGTQLSPGFMAQYNNEHAFSDLNGHNGLDESPSQMQPLGSSQDGDTVYNMDPYIHMMPPGPRIRPLDSQSTKCARWIGETGESTPYLMQHYGYDQNDEVTISKLTYRRVKTSASQNLMPGEKSEPPAVFMLADDSMAQKGEPRVEEDVLAKAQADIAQMFTEQEALRLVGLFFRFVYPYFPILSKGEFFSSGSLSHSLHLIPLSLLSAIYATALPFMLYDDLLATSMVHGPVPTHQLFRISWIAVTQELHTPRLATLQACLLLLQRAPTNRYTTDTPWKTSLVGWTVSLAQILGLSHECGDWTTIPTWEMSLRKRLWFGVYIMDKWASLGAGMPSHIRADDWDVLPISDDDLEPSSLGEVSSGTPGGFLGLESDAQHFRYLAELTMILSDIMDSYYTLRATQRTAKDLTLSLDIARSLRARLKSWRDSLPPSLALNQPERVDSRGMACLSGNSSLSLAYIVATMTLFRALLRPLGNLSDVEDADRGVISSKIAVRAGAKECAKEAVEFVEILGRGALDAFWHSCMSYPSYPFPPSPISLRPLLLHLQHFN